MSNFLTRIWSAPMRARTITLTIALLSTIATGLSSLTDPASPFHMTPEQTLLIASIGAGLYAFVRALQKASNGESLKSIFATSEAKGVAIVYVAAVATAAKGVVPPAWAGGMAMIATALTLLSRFLLPVDKSDAGPRLGPPPAVVGLLLLLVVSAAHAAPNTPARKSAIQLGGTSDSGLWAWQPAVALSALQCDLFKWDCARVGLGAGYGLVYKGLPVNLGVAGYLGAGIAKNAPNALQGNLLFSVADLGAVGPGLQVWKDPSTGKPAYGLLGTLALNLNFGGTTTYIEHLIDAYENGGGASVTNRPDAAPAPTPATPDASPDAAPARLPDAGTDTQDTEVSP